VSVHTTASAPPEPQAPAEVERSLNSAASKRRMLIIVNPYATTVSDRLKNLVVYALQGRYDVEAVATEAQNHATEIGHEARDGGYDIVVAFGGDGTLNEVANGLAGTDIPVSVLPGGSTNVVCRTLGIPNDVVDATEHLLSLADDFCPRRIDLGRVNGRRFVFACGMGLDATVVRRVDAHPRMKARGGRWYFTWAAISGFYRQYLRDPVRVLVETSGRSVEGVTAIAQNAEPLTYFGPSPIHVCEGVDYDDGTLSLAVLQRASQMDVPTIVTRVFSERLPLARHRQVEHFDDIAEARISSLARDERGELRTFPIQVDGDFIGEVSEAEVRVEPKALSIVA